ncbi:unnamed protein product [Bursaphelenchus xylophilus]|uniref:(pine wood nematode) hypothetical protein n=1 Tax=Bursaphelenchus xylophilus TaxID=6326 RepID=A0A1I7RMD4_BURXY|nr:unnamed protein product [Bursaphelenchus xylophilus]CAG9118394.1 unnamed protein product [Bursaphelenchus xylophilus]
MLYEERLDLTLPPGWYIFAPEWGRILEARNFLPILGSFLAFKLFSICMWRWSWTNFSGFRQYRLRNLTICITHSMISGGFVLGFAITHFRLMFDNPATYYEPYMKYVFQFSVGYFIHDALDMLKHEISRWTLELLFHHAVTVFVFLCPICSHDFAIFGYWGLLMEVNSVFLHMRTLHQLSGRAESHKMEFEIIKYLNVVTFVIFRFFVQIFQVHFTFTQQDHFVYFYKAVGLYGSIFFFVVNCMLLYRVLASDGFLGKKIQTAAKNSNRDKEKDK